MPRSSTSALRAIAISLVIGFPTTIGPKPAPLPPVAIILKADMPATSEVSDVMELATLDADVVFTEFD
ncbi:MAG: hypothetical protein NTX17_00175 [Candidatus Eisenbacteria bacterium]|nr:hypothetical protein [Candidatus Eisenbacteria bacterium]